jgi:hypothetical protein
VHLYIYIYTYLHTFINPIKVGYNDSAVKPYNTTNNPVCLFTEIISYFYKISQDFGKASVVVVNAAIVEFST